MDLILVLGNYLNTGSFNGGANGFKLSSISKIIDTKQFGDKTMLDFVLLVIRKQYPDQLNVVQELRPLIDASKRKRTITHWIKILVSIANIAKEIGQLRVHLESIKVEIDILEKNRHSEEYLNFERIMREFYSDSNETCISLVLNENKLQTTFTECIKYFGEMNDQWNATDFISNVVAFIAQFKHANTKCQRNEEKEALFESRRLKLVLQFYLQG